MESVCNPWSGEQGLWSSALGDCIEERSEVRGKRPGLRRWERLKAGEGDDGG